jgi:hypothetical protein
MREESADLSHREQMGDPSSLDSSSRTLAMETRELLDEVEQNVKRCAALARGGRTLLKARVMDSSKLGEFCRSLSAAIASLEAARPRADSLAERAEETSRLAQLRLDSDLREACQSRGWSVDGQWPTLYVNRAVRVEVDEQRNTAAVSDRRIRPAAVPPIVEALEEIIPTLLSRDQSAEEFMVLLAKAYDEAIGPRGGPAAIWDVYRAFVVNSQSARFWRDARGEKFVSISSDQFRARLTHALEQGVTRSPDGRELRLLPPLDPKDALFVHQPAENRFGYVGRVEFVSSEEHVR